MLPANSTQKALENKLLEMEQKLKIITQSYLQLKQLLKSKDQQIRDLKLENQKILKAQQQKESTQLLELRKKYEIDSFRSRKPEPIIENCSSQSNGISALRLAKSLSPETKPILNKPTIEHKHTKFAKKQDGEESEYSNWQTKNSSAIKPSDRKEENKSSNYLLDEINRLTSGSKPQLRQFKEKQNKDTEALILKELWDERDREIKRMDELFESLNKRINGSV